MNIVPATRKDQHITYNGTKYVIAEEDNLPPTCSGPLGKPTSLQVLARKSRHRKIK